MSTFNDKEIIMSDKYSLVNYTYAELEDVKDLKSSLLQLLPTARFDTENIRLSKGRKVAHIRSFDVTEHMLIDSLSSLNFIQNAPTDDQYTISSTWKVFSFYKNSKIFSMVISGCRGDFANIAAKKAFTPAGLGLARQQFNKQELIDATRLSISKRNISDNFKLMFYELIKIAANKSVSPLSKVAMEQLSSDKIRKQLSVDFGEILSAIYLMESDDTVVFPSGNTKLIDLTITHNTVETKYSVKSLSGSGSSFSAVYDLMDLYEKTSMTDDESNLYELFTHYKKNKSRNVDKIVAAAAHANTNEYRKLQELLGTDDITCFNDIANALSELEIIDYPTFLNTFLPAMQAGGWGEPAGLPADGDYYLGLLSKKPGKLKKAGKVSFDIDPVGGGSNILTYMLGVGVLNLVSKGQNKNGYADIVTKIISQSTATLAKIQIAPNGQVSLNTKPFADLQFVYQYHAPSNIAGNNLPGFIIGNGQL